MSYEELWKREQARQKATKNRRPPRHLESGLQKACVQWFSYQYPKLRLVCFAVPNGGKRNTKEAAIMKSEGVTAGVADMLLLTPRGKYGALCIEFKTDDGAQSESQKVWQRAAEENGNKYVIVRSLEEFIKAKNPEGITLAFTALKYLCKAVKKFRLDLNELALCISEVL